jgi:hypothetical protein
MVRFDNVIANSLLCSHSFNHFAGYVTEAWLLMQSKCSLEIPLIGLVISNY